MGLALGSRLGLGLWLWLGALALAGACRAEAPPASTAPARIVSLVPSLTEAVCLLDACDRLVGIDRHSNWPASVGRLPTLGGLDDTPLERLLALRPSLVLLTPGTRLEPRLRELGIATLSLPTQTHADVQGALLAIGERLGHRQRAESLWRDAMARIDRAAQRIDVDRRGRRVYVEVASDPYAAGPNSFIGTTLARLGLVNVVPAELGTFPRLNPEFVIRARPELIIATAAALQRMPARPGWSGLAAAQDAACGLPPAQWDVVVRPGPRLGEAAEVLVDCINRAGRPPQRP